jgi:hypothetical protein
MNGLRERVEVETMETLTTDENSIGPLGLPRSSQWDILEEREEVPQVGVNGSFGFELMI